MTDFVLDRKKSYMPPRYTPIFMVDKAQKTKEVRGMLPEFFYYFSIDLSNLYFFKSPTSSKKDAVPMTRDEIRHVLHKVREYVNVRNLPIFQLIQDRCEDMWRQEDRMARTQQVTPIAPQPIVRHSNIQQTQRKAAQRDKILNKYSTIAPVLITDATKKTIAVCAKLNNQIIYVSLEDARPGFWKLSMIKAEPMSMEDVCDFIELIQKSPKVEKACANIAPLYGKFIESEKRNISSDYTGLLYTQCRETLFKGLSAFSPLEKSLCSRFTAHTR